MMKGRDRHSLDDYISEEEREHFLSGLHRYLVWVGEKIPDKIEINGEIIKLHELIWRCIHKKHFSEGEKKSILDIVRILEKKERHDEEVLRKTNLTHKEAEALYNESAGLLRAIIDLREIEAGKLKLKEPEDEIRKKVDDARKWIGFLKNIGKRLEES